MILKNNISSIKAFALCVGFFSLFACKERSTVKPGLIPEIDNIHTFGLYTSDFDITIKSGYHDTLRTDNYPIVTLGGIAADPFFGKTSTGFYFQVTPPVANFYFDTAIQTIDSVCLALPYVGFTYGDTTATGDLLALKVFRIQDANFGLNADTGKQYYSFSQIATNAAPLATFNSSYSKMIKDTISYPSGVKLTKMARIPLPNSLIQEFRNQDTSVFRNDSTFISFFNGLYVTVDSQASNSLQRRLSFFNLGNKDSANTGRARMEIFYTNKKGEKKVIYFPYTQLSSRYFTQIKRNYAGFPIANLLGNTQDSVLVQCMPGAYTDITINNIQNIPPSVVNKAQIKMNVLKVGDDDHYLAPNAIVPLGVKEDGAIYSLADYYFNNGNTTSNTFVDGAARLIQINQTNYIQYVFNFPRELQKAIAEGKNSLTLRMATGIAYPGAYRFVAQGKNATDGTQLTMDVVYTKMN